MASHWIGIDMHLGLLALICFGASTFLPLGSEWAVVLAARGGEHGLLSIWAVATLFNTLGGITTWWIGHWTARRWPANTLVAPRYQRALSWLQRHGALTLAFSWLPIIGDPLCFVAGWIGVPIVRAGMLMAVGKGLRYAAILSLLDWVLAFT